LALTGAGGLLAQLTTAWSSSHWKGRSPNTSAATATTRPDATAASAMAMSSG
jgi:hypothetical protein